LAQHYLLAHLQPSFGVVTETFKLDLKWFQGKKNWPQGGIWEKMPKVNALGENK